MILLLVPKSDDRASFKTAHTLPLRRSVTDNAAAVVGKSLSRRKFADKELLFFIHLLVPFRFFIMAGSNRFAVLALAVSLVDANASFAVWYFDARINDPAVPHSFLLLVDTQAS